MEVEQIEPEGWREPRPLREPLLTAPWTIVALSGGLVILYALQCLALSQAQVIALGLSPVSLATGRWQGLFTSQFLHASWAHVLMNSVAALAFGPPVARLLGTDARGAAVFFAFYLACGALAGLGYAGLNPHQADVLVGASGAVSGLLGAASRLIQGHGRIGPLLGSTVVGMAIAWAIVNVILGVSGLTPGAAGLPVAWQAHLAGYAAGALLIGPFARLAGLGDGAFAR